MGLSDKKCSLQRNCVVLPTENWLGSSLNQIQGWTTVRESYSRAFEQGPLGLCAASALFVQCLGGLGLIRTNFLVNRDGRAGAAALYGTLCNMFYGTLCIISSVVIFYYTFFAMFHCTSRWAYIAATVQPNW